MALNAAATGTPALDSSFSRAPVSQRRLLRDVALAPSRISLAAWLCALIAIVNAVCWSVISPPFQLPDEPDHFAYAQHLAETGQLPSSSSKNYPPAEESALTYLLQREVRFSPENHPIASATAQRRLESALALPLSRSAPGDAGLATSQPPLYYALEVIPYDLASGGTLLDRLALMRLLSALMGGATALFAYLFLRETLPGPPWAWTVGGLGVALTPTLGMMSGAVNPDALLFAISAALFYCIARAFRRGLTRRLAIATGAVIVVGCMTKLTFVGLLPGAVCGLFTLAIRAARASRRSAYTTLAIALAPLAGTACLYVILNSSSGQSSLGAFRGAIAFVRHLGSTPNPLAYIWQVFLPRLPGMKPVLHGVSPVTIWFEQLVGKYGWLDTTFPSWVVKVALVPTVLIAVLFVRELLARRGSLYRRGVEIATYAAMSLGVLFMIGAAEYVHRTPGEYMQFRYLLPMVVLMGATLALAARGAGRRWSPIAGTLIVLLVLAHDLFSQLLVISRYYG
jgi:4-amino-4-deoxy-L-arabinose transferase-like glycosyltransferase